jgi:aminopeptidase N
LNEARFLAAGGFEGKGSWRIPVLAKPLADGPVAPAMVPGNPLPSPERGSLVVNSGQVGYYRTRYAQAAFEPLAANIAALAPADQLGLILDGWALAEAGYAPAANFLVLVDHLPVDADPRVWEQVVGILVSIDQLYAGLPERAAFRVWARQKLGPLMERVKWSPASPASDRDAVLRDTLIVALGEFNDPGVVREARARFEQFLHDRASLPPDIRQAVLAVVGRHADVATFDQLLDLAKETQDPQEKRQYLEVLAMASDPALAERALDLALAPEVPSTLAPIMLGTVAEGAPDLAWRFALANEAKIITRLDQSQKLTFIPSLLSSSADARHADALRTHAMNSQRGGAERQSAKEEAAIRQRASTRRLRLPAIDRWLATRGK